MKKQAVVDFYQPPTNEVKQLRPLNTAQESYLKAIRNNIITFGIGPAGTGKSYLATSVAADLLHTGKIDKIIITRPAVEAGEKLGFLPGPQPLDASICTPDGWVKMGDLSVNDYVIGRDGKKVKVIGIYPKGKKPVFKITTTDGTYTECCEDHLWFTKTFDNHKRGKEGCVKTTKEIMNSMRNYRGKINHYIPRNEAVEFKGIDLPIPAYTLGALLGDGSFRDAIYLCTPDHDVLNRVSDEVRRLDCELVIDQVKGISHYIRSNVTIRKTPKQIILECVESGKEIERFFSINEAIDKLSLTRSVINYYCANEKIVNGVKYKFIEPLRRWQNPIKNELHLLGLLGKKADTKFIPDVYKYSAIEDRLDLIRGLMDTDGTVKNGGCASFCTVSRKLAEDVIEVVRSLGGRAVLRSRDRVGKTNLINGYMSTTNHISYEFTVSLPEKYNPFFLRRKRERYYQNYTHRVGIDSIEYVGEKETQCILIDNDEHLYLTDNFIVTHNTLEDKFEAYLEPVRDILEERLGARMVQYYIKQKRIEGKPLAYMRGMTFKGCFVLLDEAQNVSPVQMYLFLTRIGENCKVVIDGDVMQQDIRGTSGLVDAINKLEGKLNNCRFIYFSPEDVVRSEIVKGIMQLYSTRSVI